MKTYEEFEEFFNLHQRESEKLDYKQDVKDEQTDETTGRLEETMSAMANTYGGIIIVGVKTNNENIPVEKTPVSLDRKNYPDLIEQKLHSLVYPNLNYDIILIKDTSDQTKGYIVIKIQKSSIVPHVILRENRILIRAGSQNKPASLQQIEEMLLNKKQDSSIEHITMGNRKQTLRPGPNDAIIKVAVIPVFRTAENFKITKETEQKLMRINTEKGNLFHVFPDGYEFYYANPQYIDKHHQKINTNGSVFNEKILYSTPIYLFEIVTEIANTIKLAKEVLHLLEYDELVTMRVDMHGHIGKKLELGGERTRLNTEDHIGQLELNGEIEETRNLAELDEKEVISKLCLGLLPYFNWSIAENTLSDFLDEIIS